MKTKNTKKEGFLLETKEELLEELLKDGYGKKKKGKTVKPYTTSIKILGRTYKSSSPDLRKAIETLPLGKVAKGMSVLEVVHGKNKKSVVLPPATTFRVFSSSGIIKEISMKNLLLKLGGI